MNIGIFTDTYFPQISGVATSIQTLKNSLENLGHSVFIFTTTDPKISQEEFEPNIFRFGSLPFVSFTDRRVVYRGLFHATEIAKELNLDIVHTQTEFSMGWIGKYVAKSLKIPVIHTYHTMYEDYLHYVLNGHLLKPVHVKRFARAFLHHTKGVVAPSLRVKTTLQSYGVKQPIEIIPTGIELSSLSESYSGDLRKELGLAEQTPVILTLSRISMEKKISRILEAMPKLVESVKNIVLIVAGDGPDLKTLKNEAESLGVSDSVKFIGAVPHEKVGSYYRMADLFVSASDTEAQGLTYIEAMATGTKCVVFSGEYTDRLFNTPEYGRTFTDHEEMYQEIVDYLQEGPGKINPELLEEKLEEISADTFGEKIEKFYQTVIEEN
ncbi:glycosyltransferase family 4 protein [Holzapfeliella floricola]|uniref:Glycosyltransferase n=1 Tax=Holzapfeliella floricola DSM 23037 = JCM 16512 TaxID=1423744 RepID=A0A0R2DL26_9LACO|nr:glycosyltransferase family 4 protein [Holzapfeliella floricola]KRN04390.1 glycosyltransferase [Holzapfeliella floricola DSM 23037 = JCM 16512]